MSRSQASVGVVSIVSATFVGLVAAVSANPSGSPASSSTTRPASLASASSPTPVRQFELGINVAASNYFSAERTFANLVQGSAAWRDQNNGWVNLSSAGLTPAGYPLVSGVMTLNVPQPVYAGVPTAVSCSWAGSGRISINGDGGALHAPLGSHTIKFTWSWPRKSIPTVNFFVDSIQKNDPFRDLNCREPGFVSNGVFDQRSVDDLKPFTVLRFLDWSKANANPPIVSWTTRSTTDQMVQNGSDGVALEHMIDLANATGSDAWFVVPWNSDQEYVQKMAGLVKARLSPSHKAYFELSNETWNYAFPIARQVLNEGIAEHLSPQYYENNQLRYAEKSTWMHKILTATFAGQMSRIVRVLNVQNTGSTSVNQELGFADTSKYVDAIASAPYFGGNFFSGANANVTDLPTLFSSLETMRVDTINRALAVKSAAESHGKKYITYEGGQAIVPPTATATASTLATAAAMQHSPLMYDIYQRYLSDMSSKIASTTVLYSATGPISKYGSWGIREYGGQPLAETPKRRAALEFARRTTVTTAQSTP